MSIDKEMLYNLALRVSGCCDDAEILRQKRDGVPTVRADDGNGKTVIIKYFKHTGIAGLARRMLWAHSAYREWIGLKLMFKQGALVPEPLAYFSLKGNTAKHTHAVITSDLGQTVRGSDHLARLLRENDEQGLQQMNADMINATAALIKANLLDGDHTLTNFSIPDDGRAYRLDFECSRHIHNLIRHTEWYAETLGRLIATYAFNSYEFGDQATIFAEQLIERVKPTKKVLGVTKQRVEQMMAVHNKSTGDNARINLDW